MGRFFCTCSPNSWRTCVEDSFFVKLRTYSLLLCWKLTFFCRFSMSYLYSCALVIIRSSHWEVFCKNTCGTASCPPTNSLCTCDPYPWKDAWGFIYIKACCLVTDTFRVWSLQNLTHSGNFTASWIRLSSNHHEIFGRYICPYTSCFAMAFHCTYGPYP